MTFKFNVWPLLISTHRYLPGGGIDYLELIE